jgi:exonuclease SbcC
MKIASIVEKGCLGVKEFEFTPGKITLIKGAKGKGKTSIVETLEKTITNKNERTVFVNSDSEKAEVFLVFDNDMTVKKTYFPSGGAPNVSVERDGMTQKKPEAFLKSLMSDTQINPISFIFKSEKEQTEIVLNTIPMSMSDEQLKDTFGEVPDGIDTSKHALKLCKDIEKYYFDKRTTVNAEVKSLEANIIDLKAKLPQGYDVEAWRSATVLDITKQINEATEHNKFVANCTNAVEQAQGQKDNILEIAKADKNSILAVAKSNEESKQSKIDELLKRIEELKVEKSDISNKAILDCDEVIKKSEFDCAAVDEKAAKSSEWLKTNKAIDIQPLSDKVDEMEVMKGFVLSADDLFEKQERLKNKKIEVITLANRIERARNQPSILLKSAKMPIKGLGIDDNGNIQVNGRPLNNLSGGERIEVALNIAKATAGELKLILINGFEALNPAEQKEFIESIKEDEFQYIITCVADGELTVTDES